jgi:hypothetical protein
MMLYLSYILAQVGLSCTNLFVQITQQRSKLPMASYRDVVTSAVESHQVNLELADHVCFKLY